MPEGMWIEDKKATLSVHYRQTQDPDQVAEAQRPRVKAIAEEHDLKFFEGRRIFEVRPPIEINKGTAFKAVIEEYNLDAAMYIGDDVTDVDALRVAQHLRGSGTC